MSTGKITSKVYGTASFEMAWGDAFNSIPSVHKAAQSQHQGVTLTPLDPAMVDDSWRSLASPPGTIHFVNKSGRTVDIYWIDGTGHRSLNSISVANGATFVENTYLKHPFLVVASGTGGTSERDTGTRLAAFQAQTPNPNNDPAIYDTAIITGAPAVATSSGGQNTDQSNQSAYDPLLNLGSGQHTPTGGAGSMGPDGVYKPGNGVTNPKLLRRAEPDFSKVALKLRVDNVRVQLDFVVQPDGTAANFRVRKSVGYGLDEKAIEAVRQWRFQPGMKDGQPVPVGGHSEQAFHLVHTNDPNTWYSGEMQFPLNPSVASPQVEDGSMPKPGRDLSNESAILEFTVDTLGSVKNVRPVYGSASATQLLGQYLAGWRFRPATEGGRPVEATGRVRFVKGSGDEAANRPLYNFPLLTATSSAPTASLSSSLLVGQYRREPMLNKWHQGSIQTAAGGQGLEWHNDAGVTWALTPDLKNGILLTDSQNNPYYVSNPENGRLFRLRMLPGNAGIEGFEFMGDFYKKVTPQTSAQTRPQGGCVVPPSGMVGWWSGDSDMNDSIGGHNPTGVNAVTLVPGKVGRGFQFGHEGYLEIPKSPGLENQQFTWMAWVMVDGPGPNATSLIINQNIDGSNASVNLGWRAQDHRFTFLYGHNPDDLIASGDSFPAGLFYLVAGTYDGRTFRLYVNGELQGTRWEKKTIAYSQYGWEVGAGALRFFPRFPDTLNGVIDELQAYDRALSLEEIQSIYRAGTAGVCKQTGSPVVPTAAITLPPPPDVDTSPADVPSVQVNPKDGLKYVWIRPGRFMRGCSEADTECEANEDPAQSGIIDNGFWLGRTEVTQAAYAKVMGSNPSSHKGDDLPVEMVSWFDAQKYCQAIGGRLPTEKEWEYAARAGTKYARYGNLDSVAWHAGNSGNATHPVAQRQPNAFGLYDMLGNVWEWVEDTYPEGEAKVERGGSAFANANDLRASSRRGDPPAGSAMGLGFRCAADQPAAIQTTSNSGQVAPRVYRSNEADEQPRLLSKVEPEYPEEARKAKYSGTVLLSLVVDDRGRPTDIRVTRPLGLGLDENAIEAVQKWRWRPAVKDGKPVATRGTVEISFRLR